MRIRLLAAAEGDLLAGCDFYEARHTGLGDYFLDSLSADIESLHLYAGVHQRHSGFYRLLSKRFPFAVYYRVERDHAVVYAVLDCRQDPAAIRARLA